MDAQIIAGITFALLIISIFKIQNGRQNGCQMVFFIIACVLVQRIGLKCWENRSHRVKSTKFVTELD